MIRAAVVAIVISLSGAPVVGIMCGMRCEAAAQTHHHAGCHDPLADASATAITGVHDCNHDIAIVPFVATEPHTSSLVMGDAAASVTASVFDLESRGPFHLVAPPGDVRLFRPAVSTIVLRI